MLVNRCNTTVLRLLVTPTRTVSYWPVDVCRLLNKPCLLVVPLGLCRCGRVRVRKRRRICRRYGVLGTLWSAGSENELCARSWGIDPSIPRAGPPGRPASFPWKIGLRSIRPTASCPAAFCPAATFRGTSGVLFAGCSVTLEKRARLSHLIPCWSGVSLVAGQAVCS